MMNRELIIKMAREAGGSRVFAAMVFDRDEYLERFANLVAQAEREECAKVCEDGINSEQYPILTEIAAAIRARGQA